MGKRKVILLSDNDDDQDENAAALSRGRRKGKPSEKQAQLDTDALDVEQKKIEAMQRDIQKRQREILRARKAQAAQKENEENEFESEEDASAPLGQGFSSSIQPLQATYVTPSQPRGQLRRVGAAAVFDNGKPEMPHVSSRAFKTLRPSDGNDSDMDESPTETLKPSDVDSSNPSSSPASVVAMNSSQPSGTISTLPLQPTTSPNVALKMPGFRENANVNPKKAKAADYEDVVQALILRAASEYEALISTKDAFPNTAVRNKWAVKVWKNANRDAEESYQMTDAINTLIRLRGSRIRGHALSIIRPYLISVLGFKRGSDASTVIANQALAQKLKPAGGPTFMFKSPDNRSGYAEAKVISMVIDAVWFDDHKSQGIVFEKLFNPIPLETMALVFTVIDFCIDEWSTGRFVKTTMWESGVVERHKVFCLDLEGWSRINEVVVTGIRKKLYLRASRNAGVTDIAVTKQTLIGDVLERAKQELEGRTGETDSEAEE